MAITRFWGLFPTTMFNTSDVSITYSTYLGTAPYVFNQKPVAWSNWYFTIGSTRYKFDRQYSTVSNISTPENFFTRNCGFRFIISSDTYTPSEIVNIIKNSKIFAYQYSNGNLTNSINLGNIITCTYNSTYSYYYVYFNVQNLSEEIKTKILSWSSCYLYPLLGVTSIPFTITENLTNIVSDSANVKTVAENTNFTLNYTSDDGYLISEFVSNIGTVTISEDKKTATVTGTATENITITGTATKQDIYYSVAENLTNITSLESNVKEVKENESFLLQYNAVDGYEIVSLTSNIGSVTISSDKSYATVSGTATENITIIGTATEIPKTYYTVTENLTNILSDSGNVKEVEQGKEFSLTYDSIDGYIISELTCNLGTVYISSSKTFAIVSGTATENIVITGVATEKLRDFTVTENLTNITSADTNPTEVTENEKFTLQYTSYNGYKISSLTSNIGDVTISDDKKTATVTGIATENIVITGEAYKITYVNITGTITNATCNYTNGEEVDPSKQLQIIANENYEFLGSYKYKKDVITNYFNKMNDNTILYINLVLDGDDYTLNDDYIATKKVQRISTFCNIYNVNNDELTQLSKKRFTTLTDGSIMDYGQFITNLYILPFKIPSTYKGDSAYIITGNYDTQVASTLINNYIIEINGGSLTVQPVYFNVYDVLNTTVTLHLPFFDPINLDVNQVVSWTITIKYILDVYSGSLTVNIYTSENVNKYPIASSTINISTQIPFIQKQNNTIVNQLSNIFKNYVTTQYITLTRNIPYFNTKITNKYGREVVNYAYLGSLKGYFEVEEIDIPPTRSITNDEIEELKTLLKNGVFIN